MSLGSWFRDYLYIPLGGNRVSKGRHIINIFAVWLFTGFWHGASWNFILWGVFFGVLLLIEKFWLLKALNKSVVLSRFYILLAALLSFVVFQIPTLPEAFSYIGGMFGAGGIAFSSAETLYHLKSYAVLIVMAIVGATPVVKNLAIKFSESKKLGKVANVLEPIMIAVLFVVVTAFLVDSSSNPFLYFRF
jgi:alginate O-acetyltransferase complex protein AlgI